MILSANQVAQYAEHGDEVIATIVRQHLGLLEAVSNVYYSGQWTADREIDEKALWTAVRDAAGFLPGLSPSPTKLFEQMQSLKPKAE